MDRIKGLLFEIEIARQRLDHAIRNDKNKLIKETQLQLANLNAFLFESMKKGTYMEQRQIFYLVFSEQYQDGNVMTQIEYRTLVRSMDRCDRECHTAIEVDGPMVEATEQDIALDSTERRVSKKTA